MDELLADYNDAEVEWRWWHAMPPIQLERNGGQGRDWPADTRIFRSWWCGGYRALSA